MSAPSAQLPLPAPPVVQVEALSVTYGRLRALDGVDLTVQPGELVALAGENGAGKSTLVRCLAGDLSPDTGRIWIAGRPLMPNARAATRHGVAVVWQDLALCDNLDVASNLLLGGERGGFLISETRFHQRASRLLADLGIPLTETARPVRSLSGGQRQMLAVARAMRDEPQLLIMDEPTAALGVSESAQVEALTLELRRRGRTILVVSHDVDQMFRLADRIVVLRHGRIVADVTPAQSHPDEVTALISGQEIDGSARRQLSRLHHLTDRLAQAEPSSSLLVILSALSAALDADQLSIHLVDGERLRLAASTGLPAEFVQHWDNLPMGPGGGPAGVAASAGQILADVDVDASVAWAPLRALARRTGVGSSWCVPFTGRAGAGGVITVLRPGQGRPQRDELELGTLYAGYAANAVERDSLVSELTSRNRVLETIREVLEMLAGPARLSQAIVPALQALRTGLQADRVALVERPPGESVRCRASVGGGSFDGVERPDAEQIGTAEQTGGPEHSGGTDPARCSWLLPLLGAPESDGRAQRFAAGRALAVTFPSPLGHAAVLAGWDGPPVGPDADALIEDAANSFRLALEREESERAHQEAAALRRSQELQQLFLSRLSHELRTPLTGIRGYASSLMQQDVTWDIDTTDRFLSRISTESARLERLVDDLLDFSAIEAGILRMQPDWCELRLVLDAARACLPGTDAARVDLDCPSDLPVVWGDHDRLEQVFVNLLGNAVRHNPAGTSVQVTLRRAGSCPGRDDDMVVVVVHDDGPGIPPELSAVLFDQPGERRSRTAGAGLGLSIVRGIVAVHGGDIELEPGGPGTTFVVRLPVEAPAPADLPQQVGTHE